MIDRLWLCAMRRSNQPLSYAYISYVNSRHGCHPPPLPAIHNRHSTNSKEYLRRLAVVALGLLVPYLARALAHAPPPGASEALEANLALAPCYCAATDIREGFNNL